MIKHLGLRHLHLAVRDLERSVRFYTRAFGMQVLHRRKEMVFLSTPGVPDCLTLREVSDERIGDAGGIDHFGFPLQDPADLDSAIQTVIAAGGRLLEQGALEGGIATAFVADPDGYRIQL